MHGIAIEVLTGERYESVVRREVLDPLGIDGMRMADTFDVGVGDVEHRSEDGRNYMEVLGAAGAWIAAPTDLVAILDSIDPATPGTKLLDAATLVEMQTVTVEPDRARRRAGCRRARPGCTGDNDHDPAGSDQVGTAWA